MEKIIIIFYFKLFNLIIIFSNINFNKLNKKYNYQIIFFLILFFLFYLFKLIFEKMIIKYNKLK